MTEKYPTCGLEQRITVKYLPESLTYEALDREITDLRLAQQGLRRSALLPMKIATSRRYPGQRYLVIYIEADEEAGLRFPSGETWNGAAAVLLEIAEDGERVLTSGVHGIPTAAADEGVEGTHAVDARAAYRLGVVLREAVGALRQGVPGEDELTHDHDDTGRASGER